MTCLILRKKTKLGAGADVDFLLLFSTGCEPDLDIVGSTAGDRWHDVGQNQQPLLNGDRERERERERERAVFEHMLRNTTECPQGKHDDVMCTSLSLQDDIDSN